MSGHIHTHIYSDFIFLSPFHLGAYIDDARTAAGYIGPESNCPVAALIDVEKRNRT